ncbi:MAG: signal recognition particle-docking protein FtsY [Spirochaetaceae bacterium]|nr:signal recognition particle-docking protein FtsY [Spirochaetaceae bacterium]
MKKTFSEKLKSLFSKDNALSSSFFEDFADTLIEGDLGAKDSFEITDTLEQLCRKENITDPSQVGAQLKKILEGCVLSETLQPEQGKTNIYLLLGVNGVGKTTSVAKLAQYYSKNTNVIMAAADTFRAAAIEQLQFHGEKLGIRVVAHQHNSDPGAVVFDAADAVTAKGGGLVLADTAGRLHNKENLLHELQKIDRIAEQKASEGCYKKLLVIDATTGQNALRQVEVFDEAVGIDAVIITKYDSTAKGGIAVSVGKDYGIPVAFVCFGEGYNDLSLFNAESYLNEFIGL